MHAFFKKPFLASQHANYCPALNLVSQNKCPENVYIQRAFSISISMFFVNTNYLTLFCESHFLSQQKAFDPLVLYTCLPMETVTVGFSGTETRS